MLGEGTMETPSPQHWERGLGVRVIRESSVAAEARAFMAASFSDCLCKNCLVEMNAAAVAGLKK